MMDDELHRRARKAAEDKLGFYAHFSAYVLVNAMLIALWWASGGVTVFPWFIFPLGGWGIGLFFHGFAVYAGPAYVERMALRELAKLRKA